MADPEFDELHIVSDLHLGGPPGKRIFAQTAALAGWIDHLERQADHLRIGLVLNGDIVDFLAVEDAKHFDPEGANRNLDQILDKDFKPVTDALRRFTERLETRHLVLVIGNHDVELTVPTVREHLVRKLTPKKQKGRIHVALDGRGFDCRVGDKRVHCVHGNAFDDWNDVNYDLASAVGESAIHGKRVGQLLPNGGTRLVIDVMNDVKARRPFVDLLKPEDPIRLPAVILAVDPSARSKVAKVLLPYGTKLLTGLRRWLVGTGMGGALYKQALGTRVGAALYRQGFLSEEEAADGPVADDWLGEAVPAEPVEDLLARAEEAFKRGVEPTSLVAPGSTAEMLGFLDWAGATMASLAGRDSMESLRLALRGWLADDVTLDIKTEDEVFTGLDRALSPDVDFVVAGHTHLARALRRTRGQGVYFNSGTWITLIHADQHKLASPEAFRDLYEALKQPSLDALEKFALGRRTSVAIVKGADGVVYGELRQVNEDGKGYEPMEGSQLRRLDEEKRS